LQVARGEWVVPKEMGRERVLIGRGTVTEARWEGPPLGEEVRPARDEKRTRAALARPMGSRYKA